MGELESQIKKLAQLMQEFNLLEAEVTGDGWKVGFSKLERRPLEAAVPTALIAQENHPTTPFIETETIPVDAKQEPQGTPIESPIMGIFYTTASPNTPPYVHPGDHVEEGQVIGLVEAMKVFNEIIAPHSGVASEYQIKHGELVHAGDILLYLHDES